jgi:hypothetical protein
MAVTASVFASQVTWNGNTWNADTAGLIRVDYSHSSTPLEDRTGDDEYPVRIFMVDKSLTARVTLRNFCWSTAIACTAGDLVITIDNPCDASSTCTLDNMMLVSIDGTQDRASLSEATLSFIHRSPDGTTAPIS